MAGQRESMGISSLARRALCVLWAALCLTGTVHATQGEVLDFNLPAQNIADALNALSERTGVPIVFPYDLTRNRNSNPVAGRFTVTEALDVLLAGTGLTGGLSEKGVLTISPARSRTQRNDRGETRVTQASRTGRLSAFFASIAAAVTAHAQDSRAEPDAQGGANAAGVVAEVTVTARKRQERLQDVPASVAAASGEMISDLNLVGLTELDTIAPGLTFVTNPSRFGSGPAIAMRGISTQTQSAGVQDSVGIVIDGVPISRAKAGSFPDLDDAARVEVLRGPQGTLFGKNASAGVISVATRDPTRVLETDFAVDYSTHDDRNLRASIAGPLVEDRLLGRLAVYAKSRDGYVENIFDGSKWEGDRQRGVRGKLLFTPTTADSIKLSGDYIKQDNDAGANVIRSFTPVTPQYVRDALASIAGPENDRINARSQGENRHTAGGASLQWDRTFAGAYTLTALGAYRRFEQDFHAGTYTWLTPLNQGDQFGFTNLDQYSLEVRVASPRGERLDYVAGLFLFTDDIQTGIQDPDTLSLPSGAHLARDYVSDVDTLNYAAFAEANFNVTRQLAFTTGVRWTHEKVDVKITGNPNAPGLTRFGHPVGITQDSAETDRVSWRTGVQWKFSDDQMLYALAATGFKGPAFNVNTSTLGDAQPAAPETSKSYEVGFKSQFLDRRLTANLSLYHSTFRNFQTQGNLFLPGSLLGTIVLLNAGKLETQGLEAEVSAAVADSTYLGLNATYIDATFKEFANAQCYPGQAIIAPGTCVNNKQDLSGARLPNTPKWNFNVFAKQEFGVPGTTWRGFGTLDYSWRDSIQWNVQGSPYGIEPSYGLLGASLGIHNAKDTVSAKLYGKNLTDQFHTSGISVGEQVTMFLPPDYRRVFGVDVNVRF